MHKKSGIFLTVFGSLFLGVGLIMGFFSVRLIAEAVFMRSWAECEAWVTDCELSRGRASRGGRSYKVIAAYRYSVDGTEYAGERVALSSASDNIGSFHQDLYRRLKSARKKDKPVVCWVNPDNPAESILVRTPRPPLVVFKMMFVLVFGAVGLCMASAGFLTLLTPDVSAENFQKHRIRARGAQAHKSALSVALLWNLFALWVLFKMAALLSLSEIPLYLWAAGLSGFIPAAVAFYLVLKVNKYGVSYFEISPVPGVLGGALTGNICIPKSVEAEEGFELTLQCVHQYTTRRGKNSRAREDVLWEAARHIETIYDYGSKFVVPVDFHVPYEMPPTSAPGGGNGHYWQLKVKAKTAGIDYSAVFDVPVKHTDQSCAEYSSENMPPKTASVGTQSFEQRLRFLGIGYSEARGKSVTIDFPARQPLSATLFMGLFVVLWSSVCWVMAGEAPTLFVGFFVVFDLALIWSFLTLLLVSVRLFVDKEKLKIRIEKRFAGVLLKRQEISFNDLDFFECKRGLQYGTTVYYRLDVNLFGGQRVKVGGAINGRIGAKRIAAELNTLASG